jgi:hypothetical protein
MRVRANSLDLIPALSGSGLPDVRTCGTPGTQGGRAKTGARIGRTAITD